MIGGRIESIPDAPRVIRFRAMHIRQSKAITKFNTFYRRNREKNICEHSLHRVKPRLTNTGRYTNNCRLKHASYTVSGRFGLQYPLHHLCPDFQIQYGKIGMQEGDILSDIGKITIFHTIQTTNVGSDVNPFLLQCRNNNAGSRYQSRSNTAAEMTPTSIIFVALIFVMCRNVRMAGACQTITGGIVSRTQIFIRNTNADRRTGSLSIKHAAFYLKAIFFVTCSRNFATRATTSQHSGNHCFIHRQTRC